MFRSQKKLLQRRHSLSYAALKASIRARGQLVPVYRLGGRVVDGQRRNRICRELGRTPVTVDLICRREAAQTLWAMHPVQALAEYGDPKETLAEQAAFFGVGLQDVANARAAVRPWPQGKLGPWRARYKQRYLSAQKYLGRVRQGLEPLTLDGIERALRLPPFGGGRD